MANLLLQIVPSLPPLVDGLGDYALHLAAALHGATDVESRYLVTNPSWATTDGMTLIPGSLAAPVGNAQHFAQVLRQQANVGTVLLHYVGYAYDPRGGCPKWLVEALAEWRGENSGRRLITMFHELYASGPPWRKAFWLSRGQQRLAADLAGLSDASYTSNEWQANWLAPHLKDRQPCPVWPVISNIGEPTGLPGYEQRPAALALFGRASNRARAYQGGRTALIALCAHLGLNEIHDLGSPVPSGTIPDLAGISVRAHGQLPAAELSQVLRRCRVGYLDNATGQLCKSGVFAAYASHGLAPVVERPYADENGLKRDHNYSAATDIPAVNLFPLIASQALTWYQGHAAPALAHFVAQTMTRLHSTSLAR